MKIFWLVNVKLPIIYEIEGNKNQTNVGGWLNQISEMLLADPQNELVVCYPTSIKNGERGSKRNFKYYGLYFEPSALRKGTLKEEQEVGALRSVLLNETPDIIHVHGTEFQYAYFMTVAAKQLDMSERLVVSIQGMVKYYAEHYCFAIPWYVKYFRTLQEIILQNNISHGHKDFIRRGLFEKKAIENTRFVIGRTNWDRGCTHLINEKAEYYFCNETLRNDFYEGKWSFEACEKHSVFISQSSYPIKGFHLFLEALGIVKKKYPDVKVYVAGPQLTKSNLIKGSSYGLYIKSQIKKLDLGDSVVFLGPQNAEQMKNRMLKSNVFVSPSTIENSPNSLGEAMLLGVPCISSDVGGVKELMSHNQEGYVYPLDETYMLAYYIIDIFEKAGQAEVMGRCASNHAKKTHDAVCNYSRLMQIYHKMLEEEK